MEAEEYILAGLPVVLNNAMRTWPSSSWTPEFLSQQLPQPLSCKVTPLTAERALMETECIQESVCLPDFVQWLRGNTKGDNPLQKYDRNTFSCYLDYKYMQEIFTAKPELLKAVCWESVGLEGRDGTASTLWLGSEGAYTNCHYDTYGYNLVAQIYGRKRWVLFDPSDTQHLYPTRIPFEESSIFSQVDVKNPDLKHHPKVKLTNVYEVILEPGQILYVPRHWWHYVECLEPAISINTWVELAVDIESRFEEAVTRSLFSSLWSSYINMERQVTDGHDCYPPRQTASPKEEASPPEWINPKEEIWDNSRNIIVLNEAYKALDISHNDLYPRLDRGCDVISSNNPSCATSNKHTEKNLEHFARHFKGKSVFFPHRNDSSQGGCSKKNFSAEIVKNPDSRIQEKIANNHRVSPTQNVNFECNLSDVSNYQPNKNASVSFASANLKRKHSGETYSDQSCPIKVTKSKPESCERLLGDSVLIKTISSPDQKWNRNNVTIGTPCMTKFCEQCQNKDYNGQVCQSQLDVTITAVTAQPFMTWYSLCKCGDHNSDKDISGSVRGNNSILTQENQSDSTVQNINLDRSGSCSKPDTNSDVNSDKPVMSRHCDCGSDTCKSNHQIHIDEKGKYKNLLTFEKFVRCATHPDVVNTIAKVIKNSMEND
ncbi:HSPB1-associated protein 1-like isoform X2 [Pecten maximus]|nr:HSPB1-associated protein 1-like isoform X2 [Pecten maximus]